MLNKIVKIVNNITSSSCQGFLLKLKYRKKGNYVKKFKKIPYFKTEAEERNFWAKADTTEYFDTDKAIINPSFPNLKPSTRAITIRISDSLFYDLKMLANKKDVPYQSLLKIYLAEKVKEEFSRT